MRILSRPALTKFGAKHSASVVPLCDWWIKLQKATCNNLSELKVVFGTVDYIGNDRYVFDIGGNNYRLVAMINFKSQRVYIRGIFTHTEYDSRNKHGTLVTL